jgi:3-ketosteroid 9alpha-monooxygenase subunit B
MSDSYELTVLDVVEETGDARSVVLDPGEHRGRPERPNWAGRP